MKPIRRAILAAILVSTAMPASADDQAERLVEEMAATPEHWRWGPPPGQSALIKMRLAATDALLDALEHQDCAPAQRRRVLYCLGAIRDPHSIPALKRLVQNEPVMIVEDWLDGWRFLFPCAPSRRMLNYYWTPDREMWRAFFESLIPQFEDNAARERLFAVYFSQFGSEAAAAWVRGQMPRMCDREKLLAHAYFIQWRHPIERAAFEAIVERCRRAHDDAALLAFCKTSACHEALLPWLKLKSAKDDTARRALQKTLVAFDQPNREEMRKRVRDYPDRSREDWMWLAFAQLLLIAEEEPMCAADLLDAAHFVDPSMAPYMAALDGHPELHESIAEWIVRSAHPAWLTELEPIAAVIIAQSWRRLDERTQEGLIQLGFVSGMATNLAEMAVQPCVVY